ncbi:hypothetical protein G6F50_016519 [Rhizopus delemar]|uniref:Thiamine biosynthesis protein ThiS n=1 Tax=Rhizopus delemar TaxID=936053 RepID=A0A9P6XTD6_9FUNG|nr:hypothetical protein G6F50_016519 [Rhizopus delemar]
MHITLNGAAREFPLDTTVIELLQTLGYAGKRVAVERNGEIVPKSQHEQTTLTDGDQIEIVVAVLTHGTMRLMGFAPAALRRLQTDEHSCVVCRGTSNLLHVNPSSGGKSASNNRCCWRRYVVLLLF